MGGFWTHPKLASWRAPISGHTQSWPVGGPRGRGSLVCVLGHTPISGHTQSWPVGGRRFLDTPKAGQLAHCGYQPSLPRPAGVLTVRACSSPIVRSRAEASASSG